MTTFYIIRHGQSEANAKGILQGSQIDTPLTELDALKLKLHFQNLKLTILTLSMLVRFYELLKLPLLSVVVIKLLLLILA